MFKISPLLTTCRGRLSPLFSKEGSSPYVPLWERGIEGDLKGVVVVVTM
jgi:hypothetical protein